MTRQTKELLLINALDFDEVLYNKFYVKEVNKDILDSFNTEQEAQKFINELEESGSTLDLYIHIETHSLTKEHLIKIILNTIT